MAIFVKSLCFFLITIFVSIMSEARESMFFHKATPKQFDTDSQTTSSNSDHVSFLQSDSIEKANKYGVDSNTPDVDLPTLYSKKIDEEEEDEDNDSESQTNRFERNNVDSYNNEDKNPSSFGNSYISQSENHTPESGVRAYPYGIGETHKLSDDGEDDDQKQGDVDNPFNQYEGGSKDENFFENSKNDINNNHYTRNPNNNRFVVEKQGMSDTRFVEHGKYFYNVNKDLNSYGNNKRYNSYERRVNDNNDDNDDFGRNDKANRFDSTDEFDNEENI